MSKNHRINAVLILLFIVSDLPLSRAQQNKGEVKLTIQNFCESLQPEGFVLHDPDWYFWGCSPILDDDGRVHLFVSRWPARYGFMGYRENCEIAHYVGDSPKGPFEYK